jgi:ribosomal protein S30
MAYLRRRTIRGGTYLYVVESRRRAGKVRQVTLQYLGREDKIEPARLREALRYWRVGQERNRKARKGGRMKS